MPWHSRSLRLTLGAKRRAMAEAKPSAAGWGEAPFMADLSPPAALPAPPPPLAGREIALSGKGEAPSPSVSINQPITINPANIARGVPPQHERRHSRRTRTRAPAASGGLDPVQNPLQDRHAAEKRRTRARARRPDHPGRPDPAAAAFVLDHCWRLEHRLSVLILMTSLSSWRRWNSRPSQPCC